MSLTEQPSLAQRIQTSFTSAASGKNLSTVGKASVVVGAAIVGAGVGVVAIAAILRKVGILE